MNLGMSEMIFIFLLALIIFGPKKLPEIGAQFGKALNEFKRASNEFKSQLEDEIRNLDNPVSAPPPPQPAILPPAGTVAQAGPSAEGDIPIEGAVDDLPPAETSFGAAAGADPASSELSQGHNG